MPATGERTATGRRATGERTAPACGRTAPEKGAAGALLSVMGPLRRVLRRAVRSRSPAPPLPTAQVELLLVVEENPGIGVQEAAAALQVAANTVSTLVNQLVVAGLLARTRDESDRRSAHLHLTPRAKARFETWRDRRLEALEAAMGTLSPAERRRIEQAVPALRKVMASLQGMP